MNIKDIEKIVEMLNKSDVSEFELTEDGTTIKLSRGFGQQMVAAPIAVAPHPVGTPVAAAPVAVAETEAAPIVDESLTPVESPIVGTFYRKPSPDSDSFVEVGSKVKKGDKLCIIEAMKLMNDIDSPISGIVEEICVTDSEVVEYGEILFRIRPA